MRALGIDPAGGVRELDLSGDHDGGFAADLRELIECSAVESLDIAPGCTAWMDEDGIAAGQPINELATQLAWSFNMMATLRGTVIVTGFDNRHGVSLGLTDSDGGVGAHFDGLTGAHLRDGFNGARPLVE